MHSPGVQCNLHVPFCTTDLFPIEASCKWNEMKWIRFRPPLCLYRLNWARRTSWGWWDDWDETVLQTQDSKFQPWRSEAEHATSRSRRLPTILTFTRGWRRNILVSFKPPRLGTEPRTLAWKAAVLTTTLGTPPCMLLNRTNSTGLSLFHFSYVPVFINDDATRVCVITWPFVTSTARGVGRDSVVGLTLNPYSAVLFLHKPWGPKCSYQFAIIINVLVSFFRIVWIPIL